MKSRNTLTMVLLLAAVASVGAQEARFRILIDGKWGFIDQDGAVIVEPQYDYAFRFREGHTVVRQGGYHDGTRAFINTAGAQITQFIYDYAYHFVNGFGMGVIDGKWVFIREDGGTLGLARYDSVLPFQNGYAAVMVRRDDERLWSIIDADANRVTERIYPRISYAGEATWWVQGPDERWALYEPGGPEPDVFRYDSVGSFRDGYAIVSRSEEDRRVYQVITPDEEAIYETEDRLYFIWSVSEGIIRMNGSGTTYLRSDGTLVTEQGFRGGSDFFDGAATVTAADNRLGGIIADDGAYIVMPKYAWIGSFNEYGLARFRRDDRYGFVDTNGKEVMPAQWDQTGEFRDALCPVLKDGKWGYIDTAGEVVVPLEYDYAWDFGNGLAVVRVGDRDTGERFYINTTGERVTGMSFDWAFNFTDGLGHVATGDYVSGMFGYVNADGEVVWEPTH